MGKKQHSKDRMFITNTEWATEWGGAKNKDLKTPYKRLPFYCCAYALLALDVSLDWTSLISRGFNRLLLFVSYVALVGVNRMRCFAYLIWCTNYVYSSNRTGALFLKEPAAPRTLE